MSDFASTKKTFCKSRKIYVIGLQQRPFEHRISAQTRTVSRRRVFESPVNTKAALDKAQKAHYAAEDAKELKDKQDAVTKTQKKVAATAAAVQATKIVENQKKAAMDISSK